MEEAGETARMTNHILLRLSHPPKGLGPLLFFFLESPGKSFLNTSEMHFSSSLKRQQELGEEKRIIAIAQGKSVTVEEVSKKLGMSWPKAHAILSKLAGQGKLNHERKGRINLYRVAVSSSEESRGSVVLLHRYPAWVKPKDLHQLAKEIKEYWTSESAQKMVEGERRNNF
jgi:Mn-dependent DtxR family transcriptional regulator